MDTKTANKKYKYMEETLKNINSKIKLGEQEVAINNEVLKEIMDVLVAKMKETDTLFQALFDKIFYGGSFYDGLKVNNPEEYDLDLLLRLPKLAKPVLIESDVPGYLYVQLSQWDKLSKQPDFRMFQQLEKLMDKDRFILESLMRSWMESLISKVLQRNFSDPYYNNRYFIKLRSHRNFAVTVHKSGPAMTLKFREINEGIKLDVDLVPAFTFFVHDWPTNYRIVEQKSNNEFFVVPKAPSKVQRDLKYWRPSFQIQERDILKKGQLIKPTIRLLKKLRDTQDHKPIASYYIKTIIMNNHEEFMDISLTLSTAFMKGLNIYANSILSGNISYYWNQNNNLIAHISESTYMVYGNYLKRIFSNIDKSIDPILVTGYLLTEDEIHNFNDQSALGSIRPAYDDPNLAHLQIDDNEINNESTSVNMTNIIIGLATVTIAGIAAYRALNTHRDE